MNGRKARAVRRIGKTFLGPPFSLDPRTRYIPNRWNGALYLDPDCRRGFTQRYKHQLQDKNTTPRLDIDRHK